MDWSPYLAPLMRHPCFAAQGSRLPRFQYANALDADLHAFGLRYDLRRIAGTGDTFERVASMMDWVHHVLTRYGEQQTISPLTPEQIIETCTATGCALYCVHKAIVLTEALLALGIPARRLTCLPYTFDGDCHVVTLVWLPESHCWALFDPTFNTWFTGTNGAPLSPVDIRRHYRSGEPPAFRSITLPNTAGLFLNGVECATYDEWYTAYMAKNCFRFHCPLFSMYGQAFREEDCVFLDPVGFADRNPYDSVARVAYRTDNAKAFLEAP